MIHTLLHLWFVPAIALCSSLLYIVWKVNGGTLLFRIKKADDGTTQLMKIVLGFGWSVGSLFVACFVCMISVLLLITAAIAAAFGG